MTNFLVIINLKNGKQKILDKVNTLSYSTWMTNNKWGLCLEIGQSINSNPHYFSFKDTEFEKVLILNKTLSEYMEGR